MFYKNVGPSTKTFYGVTFEPWDTKEVSGRVNHHKFISVSRPTEPPVVTEPQVRLSETSDRSQPVKGQVKGKPNKSGEVNTSIPPDITIPADGPSIGSADTDVSDNQKITEQEDK